MCTYKTWIVNLLTCIIPRSNMPAQFLCCYHRHTHTHTMIPVGPLSVYHSVPNHPGVSVARSVHLLHCVWSERTNTKLYCGAMIITFSSGHRNLLCGPFFCFVVVSGSSTLTAQLFSGSSDRFNLMRPLGMQKGRRGKCRKKASIVVCYRTQIPKQAPHHHQPTAAAHWWCIACAFGVSQIWPLFTVAA